MDAKWKSAMGTIGGVLAIPLIGLLLYGGYFIFSYKPKPKPKEPKIYSFRADGHPKEAAKGAPPRKKGDPQLWDVELSWETEFGEEVSIEGIGKVDAKGSKHVEIDKNTTYVMKVKNATGEVTYNLDVEVTPPASQ